MGLDFIRMRAGSFKKAWRRGSEELARSDLFTRYPDCPSHALVADLTSQCEASVGEKVILQSKGAELNLYRKLTYIGNVQNPPAALANAIAENGGVAFGEITQLNKFSGTADVCVLR